MAVNIMIQGTMSNAGKSLLAAGLCRVFTQDGYSTAPFKSQNMALNSYITADGCEMGRAQVVQAQACGKAPDVRMNPILLKPTTDVGSQVIVNGKSIGNMPAGEYFKFKKELVPEILKAYSSLAEENDIIVIEGAGSPAEINLKKDDIVNMGMAEMVDAPVLLVGDIDRGGVFAQLAGTVMLLEEHERKRIKGLIINKFRGDADILAPGLEMIENICGIPVAGVIPYMDVDIEDEDSLTERFKACGGNGIIKVSVIKLPRISNFSDISVLEATDGIEVTYAYNPSDIKDADLIIIPGTKSTISDLEWMKRRGLADEIIRQAKNGKFIIGICGGFQIIGANVTDSCYAEVYTDDENSGTVSAEGLGLLPVKTFFTDGKITRRVSCEVPEIKGVYSELSGCSLEGYEIHMGRTEITDYEECQPFAAGGCISGKIIGTYLHGIFDSTEFTEKIIDIIATGKGIDSVSLKVPDLKKYRETQYNRLAEGIRKSVDMEKIYRIMGLE